MYIIEPSAVIGGLIGYILIAVVATVFVIRGAIDPGKRGRFWPMSILFMFSPLFYFIGFANAAMLIGPPYFAIAVWRAHRRFMRANVARKIVEATIASLTLPLLICTYGSAAFIVRLLPLSYRPLDYHSLGLQCVLISGLFFPFFVIYYILLQKFANKWRKNSQVNEESME